jgi:hypothetical protein
MMVDLIIFLRTFEGKATRPVLVYQLKQIFTQRTHLHSLVES